MDENLFVLT